MKKRTIGLLLVVAAVAVTAYRYSIVKAAGSGSAKVCNRATDKMECNSEAAMIEQKHEDCKAACPSKSEWYNYCADSRFDCEGDCELLSAEGKSAKEIQACKNDCAKQEGECKASYRDKRQCKADCTKTYEKDKADFNDRWSKK